MKLPDNSHILSYNEVLKIAVLIPCLNEESTIIKVVLDFKEVLPNADIFVYDNNSTDSTADVARESGANVRSELLKGKGNVVRRMFADIESDIYVLVDGDDTYCASDVRKMIDTLIEEQLDMVNAARVAEDRLAFRPGHQIGNHILTGLVRIFFGKQFNDLLSGFRVFSRRFVKSFPALSSGFEIETELSVHALELRMKVAEIESIYNTRPEGSTSKLNTVRDSLVILRLILTLIKEERPFQFFSFVSIILAVISVLLSLPIFYEYIETGLVPRFPTAILCSALMILSFLSFYAGLVLDTITKARREIKRLHYLQLPIFQARE